MNDVEIGDVQPKRDFITYTDTDTRRTEALLFIHKVQNRAQRLMTEEELVALSSGRDFPEDMITSTPEQRAEAISQVLSWRGQSFWGDEHEGVVKMAQPAAQTPPSPIESVVKVLPDVPSTQWDGELDLQKPQPEQSSEPLSPMSPNIKW